MEKVLMSDGTPPVGSTVLLFLKDSSQGITMNNLGTCDISWMRSDEDIFIGTQGQYDKDDVEAWAVIE